jgi:hypothetical protein
MASTYVQFSTEMEVPNGRKRRTQIEKVLKKARRKFHDDLDFVAIQQERDHLLFMTGEYFHDIADEVEPVARMLVEELDLPPFKLEWSYTCSKMDPDQFGGGAFVIMKGIETFWVSPGELMEEFIRTTKQDLALDPEEIVNRVIRTTFILSRDIGLLKTKLRGKIGKKLLGPAEKALTKVRSAQTELHRVRLGFHFPLRLPKPGSSGK